MGIFNLFRKKESKIVLEQPIKRPIITDEILIERQKGLMLNMTQAEKRAFKIFQYEYHVPVYVQCIVGFYIVDFVGQMRNFVLEIDGNSHDSREEYDSKRDKFLTDMGLNVFRLSNEEVTFENIGKILRQAPLVNKIRMEELIQNINNLKHPYGQPTTQQFR